MATNEDRNEIERLEQECARQQARALRAESEAAEWKAKCEELRSELASAQEASAFATEESKIYLVKAEATERQLKAANLDADFNGERAERAESESASLRAQLEESVACEAQRCVELNDLRAELERRMSELDSLRAQPNASPGLVESFSLGCGFEVVPCADPASHPDAKGNRGSTSAQLLTGRRVAINPSSNQLHCVAHEIAHQLAEDSHGDFDDERTVALHALWQLERFARATFRRLDAALVRAKAAEDAHEEGERLKNELRAELGQASAELQRVAAERDEWRAKCEAAERREAIACKLIAQLRTQLAAANALLAKACPATHDPAGCLEWYRKHDDHLAGQTVERHDPCYDEDARAMAEATEALDRATRPRTAAEQRVLEACRDATIHVTGGKPWFTVESERAVCETILALQEASK